MQKEFIDNFSLSRGHVVSDGEIIVLFESDELAQQEIDHTLIMSLDRDGVCVIYDQEINECIVSTKQDLITGHIYMLGYWGGVYILKNVANKGKFRKIENVSEPKAYVPVRDFFTYGEELYVVGLGESVYRLKGSNLIPVKNATENYENLQSGYQAAACLRDEVIVVGMNGVISRMKNNLWVEIQAPTNVCLNTVIGISSGVWIAAGMDGVVLLMQGDEITIIENEITNEDFWSLCEFNNKVYLATTRYVYELNIIDFSIKPVDFTCGIPNSCFNLASNNKELLSVGSKDVLVFNGRKWSKII